MAFIENGVTVTNYFAKIVDLSPYADLGGAQVVGNNSFGQLGILNQTNISSPVVVALSFNWNDTALARSGQLSFFVNQDNDLYYSGQNASRFVPSTIRTTKNWAEISSGTDHSVARDTDGKIWTWGINSFGQLGTSDLTNRSTPVQIGDLSWNSIVARSSTRTTYGIQSGGYLWAWGNNSWGQLGVFNLTHQSSPVIVGFETKPWKQVSDGYHHTVAIHSNGTLWAWGYNTEGQLGLSNTTNRSSPTQIGTLSVWTQVAAGTGTSIYSRTLAIQSNGTLWAWGNNIFGQLGTSDTTNRFSPVQIGTQLWKQVDTGGYHTLAIRSNGTLWAWGNNNFGRLGIGNTVDQSSPVQVGTDLWTKVSCGYNHSLAIKSDGTLWAWGGNSYGQLGESNITNRLTPTQIGTNLWTQVAAGNNAFVSGVGQSLAIKTDGTLWAWGYNGFGQLGQNNTATVYSPLQVGNALWKEISSKFSFTTAIQSNGTLWSWGRNNFGQLGLSDTTNRSSPVQIGTESYWTKINVGYAFGTATKSDGSLWVWGNNSYGQLGLIELLNLTARYIPTQLGTVWNNWVQVSTGVSHTLAVQSNGSLWGWGRNNSGQLGTSDTTDRPVTIQIGTSNIWKRVECGGNFTLGQQSDGTLWAWGVNGQGQLGTYNLTQTSSPVIVGAVTKRWKQISVTGYQHSVNILTDGTLWSWGNNASGQLGTSDITNRSSPTQIGTGSFWTKTALGSSHTMALQSDGTLWTWGTNFYGNLGTSNTTSRSSPAQLGTLLWKEIAGQQNSSSLAIQSNGTLWAWGYNFYGNLGTSDTTDRYSPVQIGNNLWAKLGGNGYVASYAIQSDGTLWSWGLNDSGQLGLSDMTNRSTPTQIGSSLWKEVIGGSAWALGIQSDGTLWAWGQNAFGQLGTSDVFYRSTPTQIGTGSFWTKIAAGADHSMAIQSDGTLWVWGRNNIGQLGLSDLTNRSSPVQIGTNSLWTQISVHNQNSFALDSSGILWSWGYNQFYGELGLFDLSNRSTPSQHGIIYNNWASFSAGQQHAAAVQSNGTLWTCGYNNQGQLGTSNTTARIGFFQLGTESYWTQVVCGYNHTLALQSNGTLWAWGRNSESQVGVNTISVIYSPIQVGTKTDWSKINTGSSVISNAIDSNNMLWSWGVNSTSQLGLVAITNTTFPLKLSENQVYNIETSQNDPFALDRFDNSLYQPSDNDIPIVDATGNITWNSIATGNYHFVGVKSDGTAWSIGNNSYGQLGLNDTTYRRSLTQIGSNSNWSAAYAAEYGSMLIDTSLNGWVFGKNDYGQLGFSDTTNRSSPVQITGLQISSTSMDDFNTWIVDVNKNLWESGAYNNNYWLNSFIPNSNVLSPVQIGTDIWNSTTTFQWPGFLSMAALKSNGTLWSWGRDGPLLGLGITQSSTIVYSPTQIGTGNLWKSLSGASGTAISNYFALQSDGTLWGWGLNSYGQLATSDFTSKYTPIQIGTENYWSQISAGSNFILAIQSNGTLWGWGRNQYGQLGTSDITNRSSPIQIGSDLWKKIYAINVWSVGAKTDGTWWVWGYNAEGELGTSDITHRSSPVQMASNLWTQFGGGNAHTVAIQSNGTLWAWGWNPYGQLGTSDLVNRYTPTQIGSNLWKQVGFYYNSTLAIQSNGTLWACGYNSTGQLGTSNTTNRLSFVQVGTESYWSQVGQGSSSSMALKTDGTLWTWGSNSYGQLGIYQQYPYFVQKTFSSDYNSATTNKDNTLFTKIDGSLWVVGNNSFGALGLSNTVRQSSPVRVGTINTMVKAETKNYSSIFIFK